MRISLDVSVGEAVSTLGNYIEYNVRAQEDLSPLLPVSVLPNAFTILNTILPRISVTVILCVISA